MKIDAAEIHDRRPVHRPILSIFLSEIPESRGDITHRTYEDMFYSSSSHGQLIEMMVAAEEGGDSIVTDSLMPLSKAAYFNKVFPEFAPVVDVEVHLFDAQRNRYVPDTYSTWVLKLSKARSILRQHALDWSYYLSDHDGQQGLLSWEPVERNPTCTFNRLYGEFAHDRPVAGAARVTHRGIQYPLCGDHLHVHNNKQMQKRHASAK